MLQSGDQCALLHCSARDLIPELLLDLFFYRGIRPSHSAKGVRHATYVANIVLHDGAPHDRLQST